MLITRIFAIWFVFNHPAIFGGTEGLCQDAELNWRAGVSKIEITPSEPLRLSGYAVRKDVYSGIADPLYIRALVLWSNQDAPMAIVSIDATGLPGSMTNRIAKVVQERWGIGRARFVLAATHSHTAPQLDDYVTNLFASPMAEDQQAATHRYTELVELAIVDTIAKAMDSPQRVRLRFGVGNATISANRRVLENGHWKGFGKQADGIVDHRLGVLAIEDLNGKPKAVVYNYACHATTIPPTENRVSGDWPGLSASMLDESLGAIALPIIGCGADMGPAPTGSYENAISHGRAIAEGVANTLKAPMQSLDSAPQTEFGYAGLPSEHPSKEQLNEWLTSTSPQKQHYAQEQLAIWKRRGVLPETYPAPVHAWTFKDQLTWVFLGGEVVLDYQMRLEKEIPTKNVWVSSYCDDVFGYVSSERMRAEGGYEVDDSMIYYNLPGRWQTGTEDLLVRRVQEIRQGSDRERMPMSPEEALKHLALPDGFVIEQIASEPLVQDPVNFAFDTRGRLWVVEMRDYPLGSENGGCIKILTDTDRDGRMDTATLFLDHLSYPNSVFPYRDGAIVACAPEVFFAADRDGDGLAEYRETLIAGFPAANPQHRVNGFTFGLDGKLYFPAGGDAPNLKLPGTEDTVRASGRDLALDLANRRLEIVSGPTQYIRGRDDWNRWFGNANNEPMYQYVIDERYQERSGRSVDSLRQFLTTPSVGPKVFPLSSADGRFNDVFSANRFTSACSSVICRTPGCGPEMDGAAMICEPVHNLVHRIKLQVNGSALQGGRFPQDLQSEWVRSSDPWFRPVRVDTGPDGAVWIADMYRLVIEHPEWIPEAWQARIDLRGGADKGRIYRVRHRDFPVQPLPNLEVCNPTEILEALQSEIGPRRDLAQQWFIENKPLALRIMLVASMKTHTQAKIRLQMLATLDCCGWLDDSLLSDCIQQDESARVIQYALDIVRARWDGPRTNRKAVYALNAEKLDDELALHLILLLGIDDSNEATLAIVKAARNREQNPWLQRAIQLALPIHQRGVIVDLGDRLIQPNRITSTNSENAKIAITKFISQLLKKNSEPLIGVELISEWVQRASQDARQPFSLLPLVAAWLENQDAKSIQVPASIRNWIASAETIVADSSIPIEQRASAVHLLRWGEPASARIESWIHCLSPTLPPAIQEVALDRVLQDSNDEVLDQVLQRWKGLGPSMRMRISNSMLQQPKWILRFLNAIESGSIRASDIDASSVQSMLNTWNRDVQTRAVKIFGNAEIRDRSKVVETYIKEVTEIRSTSVGSDLEDGRKLYQQHCAVCHLSKDDVPALGPNLSSLSDLSIRNLMTGILDPNRAVDGKYKQYIVRTDDDATLAGVIVQESSSSITLASADGKRHVLDRASIAELKDQGISLMPEGFERQLTANAMRQVIAYVQQKQDP